MRSLVFVTNKTESVRIGERIVLSLWVGGMWAIGFIAVVTLFKYSADKKLAGELAGHMFTAINMVGIFSILILLLMQLLQYGAKFLKQWRVWILLASLILISSTQFGLRPNMESLKSARDLGQISQTDFKKQFGSYHKISSSLYTVSCLLGLSLLVSGLHGRSEI